MLSILLFSLVAVDDEYLELWVGCIFVCLGNEIRERLHESVARRAILCGEENRHILSVSLDQHIFDVCLLVELMLWSFFFVFILDSGFDFCFSLRWLFRLWDHFAFDEVISENSFDHDSQFKFTKLFNKK